MRPYLLAVCALVLAAAGAVAPGPLHAQGGGQDRAGAFDYYLLALSWSPSWCALEGRARGSEQCDAGAGHGWILHGLWPQYEEGWPDYCPTNQRPPSRAQTAAMADIMGTAGLAWHQWKKHGTCSGLAAQEYFDTARRAYAAITRPAALRVPAPGGGVRRISAGAVEAAFLAANPQLEADMITLTCRDGYVQEARICLTRGLEPRRCAPDTRRDCRLRGALMPLPR